MAKSTCQVLDCETPSNARGLCKTHYWRARQYGSPDVVGTVVGDPMARMASHIDPQPSGCWEWTGYLSRGYGRLSVGSRTVAAHRAVYEFCIAPIPDGLTLDHLCRVTSCVNPAHLEPCTLKENILRGEGPSAQAARRDSCSRGHEFVAGSAYVRSDGSRRCRVCERERKQRYRAAIAATFRLKRKEDAT